jgi:hypothetical protein
LAFLLPPGCLSPAGSGEDLSVLLWRAIPTLTLRSTCPTCTAQHERMCSMW